MQSYGNGGIKLILSQTAKGERRGGGKGYKVRVRSRHEVVYERELKNIFVGYAGGHSWKVIISAFSLRHVTLSVTDATCDITSKIWKKWELKLKRATYDRNAPTIHVLDQPCCPRNEITNNNLVMVYVCSVKCDFLPIVSNFQCSTLNLPLNALRNETINISSRWNRTVLKRFSRCSNPFCFIIWRCIYFRNWWILTS